MRSREGLQRTRIEVWIAVLLVPLGGGVGAAEWPRWRGPAGDGSSPETTLVLTWGEHGPPIAWQRPVGQGFSSVTAADGRLYTAWAEGEQEVVAALEAGSGREIWRATIGPLYENERGGGPRSTPTLDEDRLYVQNAAGRLAAVSLEDGSLLWSRDLVAELGAEVPIWGFAASPLVIEGRVVVPVGGEGQAVAAFDREDGALLWTAHDDAASYSSAVVADLAGRRQIVALTGQSVSGYSLDGEVLWTHPWPIINNISIATPVPVDERHLFVSSSYDVGATLLRVAEAGGGSGADEVWRDRVMKNHFQDSILFDGHLYGFDNAFLKCIDAMTGVEKWTHRGFGKGQLLRVGERLIVLGERGILAVVKATPKAYSELAVGRLPAQRYWTPPTLSEGRLYVRTERDLLALDLRAGGHAEVEAASLTRLAPESGRLTIEELIRRNVAARGEEAAWTDVAAIRATGVMNMNGRESRLTVWRGGSDHVRWEIAFRDRDELFVYDGERAWYKSVREEAGGVPPEERLRRLLDIADTYLPPRDLWSSLPDAGSSPLEAAPEGGQVVEVDLRGTKQSWTFSADAHHLVRARRGDDENPMDTFLDDWRAVDGVVVPHYVEVAFGTGMFSVRWDEVDLLREIPADLFTIPTATDD